LVIKNELDIRIAPGRSIMDERAIMCIVFGAKIREVAEGAVRSAVEFISIHRYSPHGGWYSTSWGDPVTCLA